MILQIFLILVAGVIVGYLLFLSAGRILAPGTIQNINNKICLNGACFSVEIAKTESERERGLMNRSTLEEGRGMFFIFDKQGTYPFWMKNTLIPLDIIWIGANNKVVYIAENVQPCKTIICPLINPGVPAKYVLEVNANISKSLDLKIGDKVDISIE